MKKLNIRSDLSIGDQKVGAKMNTNGLWTVSELTICGLPTDQAIEELGEAMLELNKKIDLANTGREPPKKVVKKKVEKTVETPVDKPKKNKTLKTDTKTDKNTEISGGKSLRIESADEKK